MTKLRKNKDLVWVYPPHNWQSTYNKTFVYGSCNPKAKLFVEVKNQRNKEIKIFPNGNFAQTVKLPKKKNTIKIIQILNKEKKTLTRHMTVKTVGTGFIQPSHKFTSHKPQAISHQPIIVIDPGHGGHEHGTHSPKGIPEKVFNLQISKLLVDALRATHLPLKIYLTRDKDKFVSLKDRIDFAKKKKANILISIHHNALPDNEDPLKHRGIGIYYTHNFVKPFAKSLLESISKSSGLKKYGLFKRNFALTRPDFCYAVLIECGFLIHPVESEIITNKKIQKKIVSGILKGCLTS